MKYSLLIVLLLVPLVAVPATAAPPTMPSITLDVISIAPDLHVPPIEVGTPMPGKRVVQQLPAYAGTDLIHSLYLPTDWQPGRRYPVLVEYNGLRKNVRDALGYGYGISGGRGYVWVVLPFVASNGRSEAPADGKTSESWWGNPAATVAYAEKAVPWICEQWGGDPARVVLIGYSRGAIANNFIGLHNDRIARLWCAMVADSQVVPLKARSEVASATQAKIRAWESAPAEKKALW